MRRMPAEHQLADIRAELHAITDRIITAWPELDHQARDMGRGYPSAGNGPRAQGDISRPVERIALEGHADPAAQAAQAIRDLEQLIRTAQHLDAKVRSLMPDRTTTPTSGAACESCGTAGRPGTFKRDRWCDACYRRILRRTKADA